MAHCEEIFTIEEPKDKVKHDGIQNASRGCNTSWSRRLDAAFGVPSLLGLTTRERAVFRRLRKAFVTFWLATDSAATYQ